MSTRKQLVLEAVDAAVEYLFTVGREDDDQLPVGAIRNAILAGEVRALDLEDRFRSALGRELARPD